MAFNTISDVLAAPSTGSINQTTVIGTSDPIDICKGFALFPALGTVRAGISASNRNTTVLNTSPQVLAWKFSATAGYNVFIGVCGPAYAIRFDTPYLSWSDDGSGGQGVSVKIENDDLAAGFFFGLTVAPIVQLGIQEWRPLHWYTPWKGQWESVFNVLFNFQFDLINLIFTIILLILKEEGQTNTLLQRVNNITPSLLGTWGMYDERKNQFAANKGAMSVNPTFTVPINLVPMIPGLNQINTALSALLGYLRAGPTVGVSIPTKVQLDSITVDGASYPVKVIDADGTLQASPGPDITGTPRTLGVELEHTPGFDLNLGVFVAVGVLKLFNLSASYSFPVLADLGITVKLGTYHNSLSSPIGGGPTGQAFRSAEAPLDAAPIEVVFEPAGKFA